MQQQGAVPPLHPVDYTQFTQPRTMQRFAAIAVAIAATLLIGDYMVEGVKAGAALATQQVCRSAN